MSQWRRICCAVDFSEPSRVALDEATELARQLHAELLLVHVRQRSAFAASDVPFAPPGHGGGTDDAEQLLQAWTQRAQSAAPTTSVELRGHPAQEIVRLAREFACDLVVIGTHGRTGVRRAALGSVAEEVVRTGPCPVLVVRTAG
jgi:nucleotide-binding universal stress UspA family protein